MPVTFGDFTFEAYKRSVSQRGDVSIDCNFNPTSGNYEITARTGTQRLGLLLSFLPDGTVVRETVGAAALTAGFLASADGRIAIANPAP